ncbi:MAG: VWA domain-containing protein [Alphaproteobacteria bacterium]|nr:VWA domain-containing protein [Alphaproteobacteria bacterium]MBU1514029.1 VWA domain-containing protein [Alphaproteobacteria bacterium]MBU2093031.1 VWA domain-containing protein [Alphaproteobacteria bacterium]MBU2151766.1 VWA domain-containing protein [Alphaproteobacteria bacterium]MBU2309414.1 VWA domain-containing protein [Alphaproteobacteria bacterium]
MAYRLRALFLTVLAAQAGAPVVAQPRSMIDGAPSADACAELGFRAPVARQDRGRMPGAPRMAFPAPPPPPAPPAPSMAQSKAAPTIPPLPVPPVQRRVEELVVTGSHVASPQMAPASVYQPAPSQPLDTERYPGAVANPIRQVASDPVSTFSVDVDTAAYTNVRRFLNDGVRPPSDAVRVEEMINYFDYGYARPKDRATPFSSYVALAPSPWSSQRQILHIGIQGFDVAKSEQPPLNLVFLIDTSGSMNSEDRLPLAQKSLNLLIAQLRPQDRVAMVAYAGSAGAVLAPTNGSQKLKMRCALNALQSGGSTAGGQGLSLAYALAKENFDPKAVNRVILVTDGDFNVGVADPSKLKDFVAQKRKDGVYLSVYGYGRGNYNDTMMQTLAQNGNGTAAYVDSLQEARKLFRDDFNKSMFPIADDVKIQVEFNPAQVSEYRLIGYETRMLNREDFNNDQVDAGEVGAGASVTALYEITPVGAAPSGDPLRYGKRAPAASAGGELAFLKIRYKLPGGTTSKLIERPITRSDGAPILPAAPEPTRWAVAVAGFGQKLKGDPRVSDAFGWGDIVTLAQGGRGADPYGERAEFVQLVRAAAEARATGDGR